MIPCIAISCTLCFALILLVATARTILLRTKGTSQEARGSLPYLEEASVPKAAEHLGGAVSIRTVAGGGRHPGDLSPFRQLHRMLREAYPLMHSRMEMIDCGPDNLLYRWKGNDTEALPALLLAHQDVVPASDATQWRFPPFASTVAEGYVWGRGSFDAKGQLIAICESAEALLAQGFTPRRTWYIAFGCDEETRGTEGAARISAHLERQGIRFAFVLDEGGVVADRFIAGIDRPIAVVGIAEKGDAHIRLTCTKGGGHSSTPDNPAAPAILGRAMWRLESKRPRPRMTRPVRLMLHTLGRHVPFPIAFLFLNLWLTKPLVQYAFSRNPTLGALVRSTCTVTMAQGSEAPNVVPTMASAVANIRLLPDEGAEDMLGWMRKRIGDNRIVLTIEHNSRRSKPSRIDGPEFGLLSGTITRVFPDAITVPYLMTGGTDALWYEPLSDCVFRFTPVRMDNGELKRMHGTDERLSLENLEKAMRFYMALLHEDQ